MSCYIQASICDRIELQRFHISKSSSLNIWTFTLLGGAYSCLVWFLRGGLHSRFWLRWFARLACAAAADVWDTSHGQRHSSRSPIWAIQRWSAAVPGVLE